MKAYKIFFILVFTLCLIGCAHTYIGDIGKDSPDNRYNIHIICHGKSAHAYTDYTFKKAFVIIVENSNSTGTRLFGKWVILEAADLSWQYTWLSTTSVRIDFYDKDKKTEFNKACGFLIINKDDNTESFKIAEHSNNLQLKNKIYFF